MPSLHLTIEQSDIRVLFDVFEEHTLIQGKERTVPGGAVIRYPGLGMQKRSFPHEPEALRLILEFGKDVAAGVVATWLWEKFHKHSTAKITVTRQTFDARGIEILESVQVETSAAELTELINTIVERHSERLNKVPNQ